MVCCGVAWCGGGDGRGWGRADSPRPRTLSEVAHRGEPQRLHARRRVDAGVFKVGAARGEEDERRQHGQREEEEEESHEFLRARGGGGGGGARGRRPVRGQTVTRAARASAVAPAHKESKVESDTHAKLVQHRVAFHRRLLRRARRACPLPHLRRRHRDAGAVRSCARLGVLRLLPALLGLGHGHRLRLLGSVGHLLVQDRRALPARHELRARAGAGR